MPSGRLGRRGVTRVTIDARNDSLRRELNEVMDRYKMGVDNIRKADVTLQQEVEKLNRYILNNFAGV